MAERSAPPPQHAQPQDQEQGHQGEEQDHDEEPPVLVVEEAVLVGDESYVTVEMFEGAHFDAKKFVQWHMQRGVSLDKLAKDLRSLSQRLKKQLQSLVNSNYTDFVDLSATLSHVEAVEALREPLTVVRDNVEEARQHLREHLDGLHAKYEQLRHTRHTRARLLNALKTHKLVHSVGSLLAESTQMAEEEELDVVGARSLGGVLERTAHQVHKAKYWIAADAQADSKGKHCPLMSDMLKEANKSEQQLLALLLSFLPRALAVSDPDALERCVRAFSTLNQQPKAEAHLRKHVLGPALHAAALQCLGNANEPSVAASCDLGAYFALALQAADNGLARLFALRVGGFDWGGNVVCAEVLGTVRDRASAVFSPANPDRFQKNYLAYVSFLRSLQTRLHPLDAPKLPTHPDVVAFNKHWATSVYFKLRSRAILQPVGPFLGSAASAAPNLGPNDKARAAADGCLVLCSSRCLQAVSSCFAHDVFLRPVAHRFLRLALQVVEVYRGWVGAVARHPRTAPADLVRVHVDVGCVARTLRGEALRAALTDAVGTHHLHCPNAPTPSGADGAPRPEAGGEHGDGEGQGEGEGEGQGPRGGQEDDGVLGVVLGLVEGAGASVLASGEALGRALVQRTVSECCDKPLLAVKSLSAQYQMTGKKMPTQPSVYVAQLLAPVQRLGQWCRELGVDRASSEAWGAAVVGEVCDRFATAAQELLDSVRKMEKMLQKLGNKPAGGDGDSDKIFVQIFLDVERFEQGVVAVGTLGTQFAKMAALKAVVAEGGRIARENAVAGVPA